MSNHLDFDLRCALSCNRERESMSRGIPEELKDKFLFFEEFWKGEGPFPILFARPHLAKGRNYLKHDLVEQHRDVEKLLEESILALGSYLDLIDDGIPVVRSDLGTTLLPSGLGLEVVVQPDQHPWLKSRLDPKEYLGLPDTLQIRHIRHGEINLSVTFYRRFFERQRRGEAPADLYPYVPDTQGVFDLSHLIIGTDLFLLLNDDPETVHRIQRKSLELFLAGTRLFKDLLGESPNSMVHGHGMQLGVWFPHTGARISEDTCTLISANMIEEFCLPYIREAVAPFGRGFLHFCGKHDGFLRLVCEMPEISTLNLGNPQEYDLEELSALLGRTGTVYLGHIEPHKDEDGESYLERLADLCRRHGARLILVSGYCPRDGAEKARLVQLWHELTRP